MSYTENPEIAPKSKATSLTVPGRCPGELQGLIDVGGSRVQKERVASPSANECHTEKVGQCEEGRETYLQLVSLQKTYLHGFAVHFESCLLAQALS